MRCLIRLSVSEAIVDGMRLAAFLILTEGAVKVSGLETVHGQGEQDPQELSRRSRVATDHGHRQNA